MLSTLQQLKDLSGVAAPDALWMQLLQAADRAVKSYCRRELESAPYTVYLSGNGERELLLPQRPVTASPTVYEDLLGYAGYGPGAQPGGPFAPATLLQPGVDWVLKVDDPAGRGWSMSGILVRLRSGAGWPWGPGGNVGVSRTTLAGGPGAPAWRRGEGNLKVQFTAGYPPEAIPFDLSQAVNQLAIACFSRRDKGFPMVSESLGAYTWQAALEVLGSAPELGSTRALLAPYRDVPA